MPGGRYVVNDPNGCGPLLLWIVVIVLGLIVAWLVR